MTAPAPAGAGTAGDAWALLDRAGRLDWPEQGYDAIADAADALKESLELADLTDGLGWDRSPSLAGCADGVAQDITAQGEALVAVIRKHIGEQAAQDVAGGSE